MICLGQSNESDWIENLSDKNRIGDVYLIPETGFWFGSYTNVELAPQLAVHLTDRISIGAGPHYVYYQNINFLSPEKFSTHIWGIKSFSRLSIIKNAAEALPIYLFDDLFIHVEYEVMNMKNAYFNAPTFPDEGRFWKDYLYLGGGITQRYSERSSYYIMLLWNINNSWNALYSNPTYRVGFIFYL